MKTKLLSLLCVIGSLFVLSSCEETFKTYAVPINFSIRADCNEDGLKNIDKLFKNKGLLVGENITISVIVDLNASQETCNMVIDDKVREILKRSKTLISASEFHALGTGASYTIYSAYYDQSKQKIDSVTTDYGK